MNKRIKSLLLFLFLILLNVFAFTLAVPPRPEARVSDWAGMLSAPAKDEMENKLRNFEESTGNQIAVATFPSLEGESLEAFSIKLAEQWKIGQKGKDNGVILLIFKQEAKIRIEVGYGLEGQLPDAIASRIISSIMAPYFKQGDFDNGVLKALDAMIAVISGGESQVSESAEPSAGGEVAVDLMKLKAVKYFILGIAGLLGFLFLIDLFRYRSYAVANGSYRNRYGMLEWMVVFGITLALIRIVFQMLLMSGRGFSSGGRGGSGGGGFSGGGGNFGGGGASGGW